jgi:hypothetical protein
VVRTAADDILDDAREKAYEEWAKDPSNDLSEFDQMDLIIWRPKDRMVIQNPTPECIEEKLRRIDVENIRDTIELLYPEDEVAQLGLLADEILIVQRPGTSCISTIVGCVFIQFITTDFSVGGPITKDLDLEYGYCFFKAWREGNFTKDDVELNVIVADNVGAPKFVKCYEELLSRKRKVAAHVRCFCILSFRHLTNEVRSVKQLKCYSGPINQFLTNIFVQHPNTLTLFTHRRLSISSTFCPSTHSFGKPTPKPYKQINQGTSQNATHTGCFSPELRNIMKRLPWPMMKQKSSLNGESSASVVFI